MNFPGKPPTTQAVNSPPTSTTTWQYQSPYPTPNNLNDVSAVKDNAVTDVFAVGDNGEIIRYNGTDWIRMNSGVQDNLYGVFAVSHTEAWAVGENDTLIKFNGSVWTKQTVPTSGVTFNALYSANNETWIVGTNGTMLKKGAGDTWGIQALPEGCQSASFTDIDGAGPDGDLWVAGGNIILHYDYGWHIDYTINSSTEAPINGITALSVNNIWATGWLEREPQDLNLMTVLHYTTSWTSSGGGGALDGKPYASDINHVWVPNSGMNNPSWGSASIVNIVGGATNPSTAIINAINGIDASHIWAVGDGGAIYFYNGSVWSANQATSISSGFTNIRAVSQNNVLVANYDDIWKYNGTAWSRTYDGDRPLSSIFSFDDNNIWAGGQGIILKYNTSTGLWETQATGVQILSIYGYDVNHLWAVGNNGAIYKYNPTNSSWSSQAINGVTTSFFAGYAYNESSVWVVGLNKIIKWNSSTDTWSVSKTLDSAFQLSEISGYNAGNIWSVGRKYMGEDVHGNDVYTTAIFKYNGTDWIDQSTDLGGAVSDIYAQDANHIWATTAGGFWKYNGNSWSLEDRMSFSKISKISPNRLWAITSNAIMSYEQQIVATRLLVAPSGQTYYPETGFLLGSPSSPFAGGAISAKIYALDDAGSIDTTNNSTVYLSTSDRNSEYPAQYPSSVALVNGIGTANFTFFKSGNTTITASADSLTSSTSSTIVIRPTSAKFIRFTSFPDSVVLGNASSAISIGFKDPYGNETTNSLGYGQKIEVTSTSQAAKWSNNLNVWSDFPKIISVPTTFYYKDTSEGNPTITARWYLQMQEDLPQINKATISQSLNVSIGSLSNATIEADHSTINVGQPVDITVTLRNSADVPLEGKVVRLTSSRNTDSSKVDIIPSELQTTNSEGKAYFKNITSQLAGIATFSAVDVTDALSISDTVKVSFSSLKASNLIIKGADTLTALPSIAGIPLSLTVSLKDKYGNPANNPQGELSLFSSDLQANIPSPHTLTIVENGTYTFEGVILKTTGNHTITISYTEKDTPVAITSEYHFFVTPSSVSATLSSLTIDKELIKADGRDSATITVVLKDNYGNNIQGKQVKLKSSKKTDVILSGLTKDSGVSETNGAAPQETMTTNTNGKAYFQLTTSEAGQSKLSAIDVTDDIVLNTTLQLDAQSSGIAGVLNNIKNNKTVKNITRRIFRPLAQTAAAAGLIPMIVQGIAALPQVFQFFAYLFALLAEALGFKRKPKPWGVVFDSVCGKPVDLAVVRLYDSETKRLIATRVTDMAGRFGFSVEPGVYVVSVTKPGYLFPVTKNTMSNVARGEAYYIGSPIRIDKRMENLSLSIPVEPMRTKMSFYSKMRLLSRDISEQISTSFIYVLIPIIFIGITTSAISAYVTGETKYYVFTDLGFVMAGFYIIQQTRSLRHHGTVLGQQDQNKKKLQRLPGAIVYLFDSEFETLRGQVQTDKNGRFTLYVPPGKYYLSTKADGYILDEGKTNPRPARQLGKFYKGEVIDRKQPGYISVVLIMKKG